MDMFAHVAVPDRNDDIALTGNKLNTSSESRSADCVKEALSHPGVVGIALAGNIMMLKGDPEQKVPAQILFSQDELKSFGGDLTRTVLLGHDQNGVPHIAVPSIIAPENAPEGHFASHFRAAYIAGYMSREDEGVLAQGAALLAWNESTIYCWLCG